MSSSKIQSLKRNKAKLFENPSFHFTLCEAERKEILCVSLSQSWSSALHKVSQTVA